MTRRLPELVPVDAAAQLDTGVLLDSAQPAEQQAQRRGKEQRVDLVVGSGVVKSKQSKSSQQM